MVVGAPRECVRAAEAGRVLPLASADMEGVRASLTARNAVEVDAFSGVIGENVRLNDERMVLEEEMGGMGGNSKACGWRLRTCWGARR